jgi:hypothetical protein
MLFKDVISLTVIFWADTVDVSEEYSVSIFRMRVEVCRVRISLGYTFVVRLQGRWGG